MYRQIISNGDLIQLQPSWFGFGPWKPHRNLSEEVRKLHKLEEEAKAKYLELAYLNVVASTNVAEKLETLQILLLENSDAYFEVGVDNSILEKREGVKYNFNRGKGDGNNGNNKQGNASSNKDKQGGSNNGNDKQGDNNGGGKGKAKVLSISDLFGAKLILH